MKVSFNARRGLADTLYKQLRVGGDLNTLAPHRPLAHIQREREGERELAAPDASPQLLLYGMKKCS